MSKSFSDIPVIAMPASNPRIYERIPAERLSIDNDMPIELAARFIGRTETETARNIEAFNSWLTGLIDGIRDELRKNGYPLTPMGGR